ncbi:MAG TPA: spore coat protein [Chondromyces sp.]|nr:spore coat protein [Chondromyces sp.]
MSNMMQNMAGVGGMTDQVIATDLLISAKTGVKNIALALTETSTPEVRSALKNFLNDAVDFHEQVYRYMESKGYYHAHDLSKQLGVDLKAADTALNLQNNGQQGMMGMGQQGNGQQGASGQQNSGQQQGTNSTFITGQQDTAQQASATTAGTNIQ